MATGWVGLFTLTTEPQITRPGSGTPGGVACAFASAKDTALSSKTRKSNFHHINPMQLKREWSCLDSLLVDSLLVPARILTESSSSLVRASLKTGCIIIAYIVNGTFSHLS